MSKNFTRDIFSNIDEKGFLKGLDKLFSLDDKQQQELMKFFRNVFLDKNIKVSNILSVINNYKLNTDDFRNVINAVIIIFFSTQDEYEKKLIPIFKKYNFDNMKKEKIEKFTKQYYTYFEHFHEREEIEKFGIPYFSSLDVITDYRILNKFGDEREIIPIILCKINLKEDEQQKELSFIFQFSLDDLDNIISHLNKFKENIKKDNKYLESKGVNTIG